MEHPLLVEVPRSGGTVVYPMPITNYVKMIHNAYGRKMILHLAKWKLKDNYTYQDKNQGEP